MPLKVQPKRTPYKQKALRLITPELANDLGQPAEAPMFCSPYITHKDYCLLCLVEYTPLIYQQGATVTAQHFCKGAGGGIYVFDKQAMVQPYKWLYRPGLWIVTVLPHDPIRIGHDKGFTFKSVTVSRIHEPRCTICDNYIFTGSLISKGEELQPICSTCKPNEHTMICDWSFVVRDDGVHFMKASGLTIPEGVRILL